MNEGVEAGENKQRDHGTQRHDIIKLGLKDIPCVAGSFIGGGLQPAGEVLRREDIKSRCLIYVFYIHYNNLHIAAQNI